MKRGKVVSNSTFLSVTPLPNISSFLIIFSSLQFAVSPLLADFGDADFPLNFFQNSPKSYHDGWCREVKRECRIRFQGPAMWVEGQGGIFVDQYKGFDKIIY